jgi:hypothetical protein
MDWAVVVVQWLHIVLGIIWFGNALVVALILIPTLNPLPILTQRDIGQRYGDRATRIINVVGPTVIALGIIRGTLLGPIKSVEDVLGMAYGITWLVALITAVGVFLWGRYAIGGALERMNTAALNPDGTATAELEQATSRVKLVTVLELIGFFVIFTCMILMRFGL